MKREKILKAAVEALRQSGMKKFNVGELAQTLHISKRTIYDLFCSKKDLIESAVDYMFGQFALQVEQVANEGQSSLRGLINSMMVSVKFFSTMASQFYNEIAECRESSEYATQMREKIEQIYSSAMERSVDEGYLNRGVKFETISKIIKGQF